MNNIILIGFMGCGKSSVGRRLSYRVRLTFVDTDIEIEKIEDKKVSEIFNLYGEPAFRKMEHDQMESLLADEEKHIISVGGGLPIQECNHKVLKELGTIIYLRVTPRTIIERLKDDTTRPLLMGDNPELKIKELMKERDPIYEMLADFIIDTDDKDFKEILDEIEEVLS